MSQAEKIAEAIIDEMEAYAPRYGVDHNDIPGKDFMTKVVESLIKHGDIKVEEVVGETQCAYTHSHTREFCGNPGCRES